MLPLAFLPLPCYMLQLRSQRWCSSTFEEDSTSEMDKNLDIISYAVSLIIKAGRFSEKVRRRSLKRLVAMDADTKDKEIIFLKDKIHQLQM